ncbi:MAG: rod shape-determining protein MreD [Desulfobulbaceae bacterium]|nr:rod shape-determining protein MreD [Desulfobulbaceae bacterium]
MPVFFYFFLAVCLLILQTSFLTSLPDWLGRPDPLFILIVFIAVRLQPPHAPVLLLLLGLIMDIFSGIFLGIYPIAYLLLFFILYALSRRLIIHEQVHQIPLVLSCYLFVNGLLFGIASFLAPENSLVWNWKKVLLQMLLLGIMTLPLFAFFDFLDSWLTPKKAYMFFQRKRQKNTFRD